MCMPISNTRPVPRLSKVKDFTEFCSIPAFMQTLSHGSNFMRHKKLLQKPEMMDRWLSNNINWHASNITRPFNGFLFFIARTNVTAVGNERQGNRYKTRLCLGKFLTLFSSKYISESESTFRNDLKGSQGRRWILSVVKFSFSKLWLLSFTTLECRT